MLFELAGVSFFFSYILAALTFTQRMRSRSAKVFGVLTTLFLLTVFVSFGIRVLYPLAVFASGYLVCRWQDARRGNEKPAAESRSQ